MFGHLTDFAYKRNAKEAIGFFLAYLILIILLGGLTGGVIGLLVGEENSFEAGLTVGNIIGVLVVIGTSILILKKKNILGNFGYIILTLNPQIPQTPPTSAPSQPNQ